MHCIQTEHEIISGENSGAVHAVYHSLEPFMYITLFIDIICLYDYPGHKPYPIRDPKLCYDFSDSQDSIHHFFNERDEIKDYSKINFFCDITTNYKIFYIYQSIIESSSNICLMYDHLNLRNSHIQSMAYILLDVYKYFGIISQIWLRVPWLSRWVFIPCI